MGITVHHLQTTMRDESAVLSSWVLFSVPSAVRPRRWFVHGPRRRVRKRRRRPGRRYHAPNQLLSSTLSSRQGTSKNVWMRRGHALQRRRKRRRHRQWTL